MIGLKKCEFSCCWKRECLFQTRKDIRLELSDAHIFSVSAYGRTFYCLPLNKNEPILEKFKKISNAFIQRGNISILFTDCNQTILFGKIHSLSKQRKTYLLDFFSKNPKYVVLSPEYREMINLRRKKANSIFEKIYTKGLAILIFLYI